MQQVKYEGISSLCFCCGRLRHKKENCWYQVKEKEKNGRTEEKSPNKSQEEDKSDDSVAEKSTNQVSEEDKSDPNFGPWMLVSRKRSLVKNGRSRSSFGNEVKDDVNSRGMSVQRGEKLEGSSAIPIKEKVLPTQFEHTRAVRSDPVQGIAPNEDMGNLEIRVSALSPNQGDGVTRTDGKLQMGFLGSGTRSNRINGGKGPKSLKRQYPSSSYIFTESWVFQKSVEKRDWRGSVWVEAT